MRKRERENAINIYRNAKNRSPPPEEHHDTHSELGEEVEVLPAADHIDKKKKKVS